MNETTKDEIIEKLLGILIQYTEVPGDSISEDTSLQGDLELSSLDMVNIVVDAEDAFGIEVRDEDIREMITVSDVVNYIQSLL